jgi:hypothetical protein
MSHEDFMQPDELARERERFASVPPRQTSAATVKPQFLSRTTGYITVDIPPITIPTPAKAARWLATSPAVRVVLYILLGVIIWQYVNYVPPVSKERPAPATETLSDFVDRESKSLSADERKKLIAATEKILTKDFDTPSALREEFYYQRLKSGLHDSPDFNTFWDKVADKVQKTADGRQQTAAEGENVEFMREVYRELLRGLQDNRWQTADGSLQQMAVEMTDGLETVEKESAAVRRLPSSNEGGKNVLRWLDTGTGRAAFQAIPARAGGLR